MMTEKKGYKGTENFYAGADYGLDPDWGKDYAIDAMPGAYKFPASQFGFPTDPRTANQLKAVSDKLSTGAKTIEVSGVQAAQWETLPEQHLDEINRLKKLVGVDLTFHGPLVEPTGISRQGWNESHREQAERQMWSAVKRAHKLEPKGNIVVTFHSSNGIPDPESRVMTEVVDPLTGKKKLKEQIKEMWVVNSATGRFEPFTPKPDYFRGRENQMLGDSKEQIVVMKDVIDKQNKEAWYKQLQGVTFHAHQGAGVIREVLSDVEEKGDREQLMEFYQNYLKGGDVTRLLAKAKGVPKEIVQRQLHNLTHGDIYLRDAYQDLQNLFNRAYETAKENNSGGDLKKLDSFREEIGKKLQNIEDPGKVNEFAGLIVQGVNVLRSISPPKSIKTLRDFAIDKSAETFANLGFNSYKEFKDTAPIISVENPPAGSGLTRAEDLKKVVEVSREKLAKRLMEESRLSERQAKKQAEKLIGVTWDVGHINMIRKFGYSDKDIIKETEKIAPFVKHAHLSDNFGLEHTELPMGMGNVPVGPMLEAISQYNKQIKKIVETGNWFGPQAFGNQTPFRETLRAFGSPVYSMEMAPYWNQAAHASGGYFVGYGQMLPEQHFSMYGSGFANLPPELGGQMSGRSRMGGAPSE